MMHRETGNAAAVTGYRGGLEPGSAMNLFQALSSDSDEIQPDASPIEVKKTKVRGSHDYTADIQTPRQKELRANKKATNKNDNLRSDSGMLKASSKQNTMNKSDIFLSKDVLERLAAQAEEKNIPAKRTTKNAGKSETTSLKNKSASAQKPESPVTPVTKPIAKKRAPKAAVRPSTLNNTAVSKVPESDSISIIPKTDISNKLSGVSGIKREENEQTNTDQLLTQCPTTFSLDVPTTVEITVKDAPDATLCGVCSQKNCQSDVCKSLNDIIDATCKKDFKFSRDSSEDSGCYSNLSRQSTTMEPAGGLEVVKEDNAAPAHEVNEADANKTSITQCGTCGSCKSDMPTRENGLCKNCWNKIKKESGRIGTLDEFRAYAKSIAQSVKRILDIRPKKAKEEPSIDNKIFEQNESKQEAIIEAKKGKAEGAFHRFKTEIPLVYPADPRGKTSLNRSASYDGKIILVPDDEHIGLDVVDISSTSTASIDLKARSDSLCYNLPSMDEREMLRMEKYLENRKKKLFRSKALRGEESSSSLILSRSDEKTKMLAPNVRHSKIRKSVERAGTDGDLRPNVLGQKNVKRQGKEMEVKKIREPDADIVEFGKRLHKSDKDNKNALRMSMMKVINEGTPVDPPESGDKKARRTALSRSATVPYKIYAVKKDSTVKEKSAKKSDSILKSTRSSTKITMRANKASSLRKENSIKGKEKSSSLPGGPMELWRGEHKLTQKGRSTSYDGSFSMYAKKHTEVVRSRSRSTIREEQETKNLNVALLKTKKSNDSDYTPSVSVIPEISAKAKNIMAYKATDQVYSGAILGQALKEKEINFVENPVAAHTAVKTLVAVDESYCDGVKHLPYALECQLTAKRQTTEKSESYYRDKVAASLSKVSETSNEADDFSKTEVEETLSEKTADVYTVGKVVNNYDSTSYYEGQESALSKRDRSHESKSSTSFHLVTSVKGSHSDVALMRSQGMPDYATYRRQSGNPESDVDTGVIYHFGKRQTTRAHVPPYHDLTAGIALYTMSGDVSSSESSFSGTSVKSEVSDNMYTGGFYKDPFYEQENNGDSSSASSSCHLYFEPNEVANKQETSDHDLYTGGVFSSNLNAISLGYQTGSDHRVSSDFSKNGSTNNSTRPTLNRLSRRQRARPRIDFVMDYNIEALGYNQANAMIPCVGSDAMDWSNNSNNGQTYRMTTLNEETSRPTITLTDDSAYTDYVRNHRPKPPTSSRSEHPFQRGFDFSKYEIQEAANTGFFFQTPKKPDHEDIWYRGPYVQPFPVVNNHERTADYQNMARFQQSQEEDDNYTNIICPKYRNNNNSNSVEDENVNNNHLEHENINNNHLEHFYTGDYSNEPPEARAPPPPPEPIYEDLPSKYASPFYLRSGVTTPQSPPPQMFSRPDMTYSSSGTYGGSHDSYMGGYSQGDTGYAHGLSGYSSPSNHYGQTRPEKLSSSYTRANQEDSPWTGYDQAHTPLPQGKRSGRTSDYEELPSQRYGVPQNQQEERDSYFDYTASRNPSASQYVESSLGSPFSPFGLSKSPAVVPVVNEIKKVGGIVCRENVVNKEDYAEDVNRDLMDEPGAWVSFKYRAEEDCRNLKEMAGARNLKSEVFGASDAANAISKLAKTNEESPYAHNHVYDNQGARNNWREMNQDHGAKWRDSREATKQKPVAKPDPKKEHPNKTTWRPSDQIPERAMGKRPPPPAKRPVSPTVLDGNNNTSLPGTGNMSPKTPSKINRIQYSSSPCVKSDPPKTKWRNSVVDHPHPRARAKAKKTPQAEARYISNVVQVDEMMFIRARRCSGDSDGQEVQLDLMGSSPAKKDNSKQIPQITNNFHLDTQPLFPLHCVTRPTWILLETPNIKPKEVQIPGRIPSGEKSGQKSIVASPKTISPGKTNSYKSEERDSLPTREEIEEYHKDEKQAGDTVNDYVVDDKQASETPKEIGDNAQAAETPNYMEEQSEDAITASETPKEIENDKVDDERASETPKEIEDNVQAAEAPNYSEDQFEDEMPASETPEEIEDNNVGETLKKIEDELEGDIKASETPNEFEDQNEKQADETAEKVDDENEKKSDEIAEKLAMADPNTSKIDETKMSSDSDPFEHLKTPDFLTDQMSKFDIYPQDIFQPKMTETRSSNGRVSKQPSGIQSGSTVDSHTDRQVKEAISLNATVESPLKAASGKIKEQREFEADDAIKEAVHQINIENSRRQEHEVSEREQQKYFMMTTILMKKNTIHMPQRKREPRLWQP
ncbi:unnamed protein product [Lymnaea stagnalis]|uniref:Uncharacterized protein n=1 Tax=Lymnaea stagnalis TaxID=6523 RepID=A0AAV2I3S2_LYMST